MHSDLCISISLSHYLIIYLYIQTKQNRNHQPYVTLIGIGIGIAIVIEVHYILRGPWSIFEFRLLSPFLSLLLSTIPISITPVLTSLN